MALIKDPDWYLTGQDTPDKIYTNAVFFALALYHWFHDNLLLGSLFALLGVGSTAFHLSTSRETLLFDRLAMILVFSYFFNLFYPSVSFPTYSLIGLASVLLWYGTEELAPYFLFQALGLFLYLKYFPMRLTYKLAIIGAYIGITYLQMLEEGRYHSLKHVGLAALSLTFKTY